jgi:hypothetical protein
MAYGVEANVLKTVFFGGYGLLLSGGVTSTIASYGGKPLNNLQLQDFSKDLAKTYGIGGGVDLFQCDHVAFASSSGAKIFKTFKKAIFLDWRLPEIDIDAATWSIRHEMCLLKHNSHLLSEGAHLISAVAFFAFTSFPAAILGTIASHLLITGILQKRLRLKAAKSSFEDASQQELEGAVRLLQAESLVMQRIEEGAEPKLKCPQVFTFFLNGAKEQLDGAKEQLDAAKDALKKRFQVNMEVLLQDARITTLKNRLLFLMHNELDDDR